MAAEKRKRKAAAKRKAKRARPAARITTTKRAIADHFGVSQQAITKWFATPGFPYRAKPAHGYDLGRITEWRATRRAATPAGGSRVADALAALKLKKEHATTRRETAAAEVAEMNLAKLTGALLTKETLDGAIRGVALIVNRELLDLVEQLPPMVQGLDAPHVHEILAKRVDGILQRLRAVEKIEISAGGPKPPGHPGRPRSERHG